MAGEAAAVELKVWRWRCWMGGEAAAVVELEDGGVG
jgi:hypothetical protein